MKILKSWLADHVKIEGLSDKDLDAKITFGGIEVEGIDKRISDLVIVAEIKEIKPHPNADRLRLASVDTGSESLEVVCGAPNIEVGQKVPFAQIGAILSEGVELKEATIRGVISSGMLCAADELGLCEDHSGIIILPDTAKLGQKVSEILASDTIFNLKPTPNRGDSFSHLGIAREVAALADRTIANEALPNIQEGSDLTVEINDQDGCYSYFGAFVKKVKIEESPDWIKNRLIAVGAKPINNIVDITNYVMLDLGQPLHAFDADKVKDHGIIVRFAGDGEEITTIDGVNRKLTPSNLLITDKEKAIAVAGVMGGENSEISSETKDIILESAEFAPSVIRKSAKLLNLSTEASYRFERGVDPLGVEKALAKAVKMIVEIAGGELIGKKSEIAKIYEEQTVKVEYDHINDLLGLELAKDEIDNLLKKLSISFADGIAHIPSWRHDLTLWQDLAEEVGRLYSLNKIPLHNLPPVTLKGISDYHKKEYIKDILIDNGFTEVANYSIISEEDAKLANLSKDELLEIANPVQPENKYMRNSLIPGLLKTVAKNSTFDPILVFEFGNVFDKTGEETNVAIAASGKNAKSNIEQVIEAVKKELEIKWDIDIKKPSQDETTRYKIRKPNTCFIELNAKELIDESNFAGIDLTLKITEKNINYRPISKYPSVTRDLAFIVNKDLDTNKVNDKIFESSELINRVELFDEFASDKFGQNKKNVAYHLYLQHPERTLTDKEAEKIILSVISDIEKTFNAKLRTL